MINLDFGLLGMKKPTRTSSFNVWVSDPQEGMRRTIWPLRNHLIIFTDISGLPWCFSWLKRKTACNAGDLGSIPRSGKSPGDGNGYPLLYSYLENFMDRGAWQAVVSGVA